MTEGAAISQYIADQVPERRLAPPNGTVARTQLQSWLNFIATGSADGVLLPDIPSERIGAQQALHRERLGIRLAHIERHLERGGHMMGEHFSLVDAYVYVVLNWSRAAVVDLSPFPLLLALRKRVVAQPAVQAALSAEGFISTDRRR